MKRSIFNSSKKIIGEVEITNDNIIINNFSKPILLISDKRIISFIINKDEIYENILELYDSYTLTIGEIAALFDISYTRANKWIKSSDPGTSKKSGRRNSSYGKTFSKERINNMVNNRKDDHKQLKNIPKTKETKEKISETLKRKYRIGELIQDPAPHRENWKNGVYDNVNFKSGIGGHIFSLKNNKEFLFRSLLELYYFIKLEEDSHVSNYEYEPTHIKCDDGTIYTPDFLVNNELIELKSYKYINNLGGEIKKRFEYKKEQGIKYSKENGLTYRVIWDKDLNFDSRRMKTILKNNPEIILKYKIIFFDLKRVGL